MANSALREHVQSCCSCDREHLVSTCQAGSRGTEAVGLLPGHYVGYVSVLVTESLAARASSTKEELLQRCAPKVPRVSTGA